MRDKSSNTKEALLTAKQKFGRQAAELIISDLNVAGWDGKKGCCPFHSEDTASFIWRDEDEDVGNYFHCFGCGATYDIISHFMKFHDLSFVASVKKLCDMTDVAYAPATLSREEILKKYKFPKENHIDSRGHVDAYMAKRHISSATLDYVGVKEDKEGNAIFEYRDFDGTLMNIKYRPARAIKKGQSKMWFQEGADNCPLLLNMHKIDVTQPLYITEGEIDQLALVESGVTNAVSIPFGANDTKWIDFNYEWLEQFDKIVLWFDNDIAGKKAVAEVIPRLGRHRTYYVDPPDDVLEGLRDAATDRRITTDKCDANNVLIAMGINDVVRLVREAKDLPSKKLKYLMDCEEIDIQNMTKVSTGFKELDKKIYGNILPCFNIITGYTGSGKSTVSSTSSVISPVENGYNAMVFSGELHEGQLKNWILKPLAGRGHMFVWKNPGQPDGYSVSREAAKVIEKYYHDKIILYTDHDDLETSSRSLLDEMEYAYKRYNTKFFLIDNLMCVDLSAVGANESTEWDSQKRFIKQLMKFTNKYMVNTTLIIHPKKPGQNKERNAYELHGASEIGNLCHRLFWVVQLKDDPDGYNAAIEVIKDRPTAKQGTVCKFYYDFPTMRLYSDKEELNKKYSWEDSANITYSEDMLRKLVCNQRDETNEVLG